MALNFPNNPSLNQTYTDGKSVWKWNGFAWDLVTGVLSSLSDLTNLIPESILDLGISDGTDGQVLTTDGEGNFTFTTVSGGGGGGGANTFLDLSDTPNNFGTAGQIVAVNGTGDGLIFTDDQAGSTQNLFATITSDDGSTTADSATDTLNVLGGTNISTIIATDTKNLTINLDSFEIGYLSNVSNNTPTSGQVLKWDGAQWAPAADVASGGAGLDADTLDGFDSTYYLDYNNFTNTPSVLTLTSLSVGNELTASGDGAISYDDTTGVFRYTPPDLSSFLTSVAFADLTSTPTTLAGYGITDAFDGDFGSLSNTPTTLSGYGITDAPTDLTDLGISDGTAGQVLTTDGAGNFTFTTVSGGGGGDTNQNAFSTITVVGQNNIEADDPTDTLNLVAGSGISITTNDLTDTLTIQSTVSAGATNFTELDDVVTSGLDTGLIYEPAIAMLRVDNIGTSAYTFNSHYTGNNPTLYALGGTTIAFDLSAISGHPFELQDGTGSALTSGLVHVAPDGTVSTDANAQGKTSGTLYWRIQESISGTYRYQCQSHAAMVGAITVKRLAVI